MAAEEVTQKMENMSVQDGKQQKPAGVKKEKKPKAPAAEGDFPLEVSQSTLLNIYFAE